MPIVIDEIVINIEVPASASASPAAGQAQAGAAAGDRQALVAEVVEQVLDILQRRLEP